MRNNFQLKWQTKLRKNNSNLNRQGGREAEREKIEEQDNLNNVLLGLRKKKLIKLTLGSRKST